MPRGDANGLDTQWRHCIYPVPSSTALTPFDYPDFVEDLKRRIDGARLSAARAVNRELVGLYWDIGQAIREQQTRRGWGDAVVDRLARDLSQFHETYTTPEFLAQLVRESGRDIPRPRGSRSLAAARQSELAQAVREMVEAVPWGHHVNLLSKLDDPAKRLFYLKATARFGWSRNVLLNQIKAQAYERSLAEGKVHNFALALPGHLAEQAEEALKSSYNLEFLGIQREIRELELEDHLIDRLRDFILELGYGFCFVGRQYRLPLGRKEYFIDLLFYHRFLKALVAIELKIGSFEPEFAGKMDFDLNLLNEKERASDDAPSIGIILCAEKDNLEVEFALKSKSNPIGVTEYQLQGKLPVEMKGKLPSARLLQEVLWDSYPRTVAPDRPVR
ncbi:putative nuclease of restriction endonuclease-like (RecB) superfamily [Variovorax boronicumulans]|uniref:PDDEXK nuclease domain-containing protein n=1 Tax=Variovorax boronicumulans TaxID=436515 RepID=UPI00277D6248|nr:PDDEXK nuclease domain-containing protein [Variovorax boronicumulans]MDP9919053.1 putative nuclease of restriction endonuclease-like (RecB) superfamily [Variovorax boronicumulans]